MLQISLVCLHAYHVLSALVAQQDLVLIVLIRDDHHWLCGSLNVLAELALLFVSHVLFNDELAKIQQYQIMMDHEKDNNY